MLHVTVLLEPEQYLVVCKLEQATVGPEQAAPAELGSAYNMIVPKNMSMIVRMSLKLNLLFINYLS